MGKRMTRDAEITGEKKERKTEKKGREMQEMEGDEGNQIIGDKKGELNREKGKEFFLLSFIHSCFPFFPNPRHCPDGPRRRPAMPAVPRRKDCHGKSLHEVHCDLSRPCCGDRHRNPREVKYKRPRAESVWPSGAAVASVGRATPGKEH